MKYHPPVPMIEGAPSMSLTCLEWLYRMAQSMKSVVEVGSYKGRSMHALLSGCSGPVYAVDHWIMPTGKYAGQFRAGAFETFKKNVGHFPNLNIMRMPSLEAVLEFQNQSVDMVFIDGDHSYEGITVDIHAWLPKVRKLLCGHDFHGATPGVMRAVEENFLGTFCVVPGTNIWAVEMEEKKEEPPKKRGRKAIEKPPQDRMIKAPPEKK